MRASKSCLLAAALVVVAASGCDLVGLGGPTRTTLTVQHHAVECVGVWIQPCLLVQQAGQSGFGFLYHGIEGFEYEWGFVYELEIEEHHVPNPPADGSSIRRVLRTERSRSPVPQGTEFDVVLTGGLAPVELVGPGRYRYVWWPDYVCAPGVACQDLALELDAGKRVHFRFAHATAPTEPLTVLSWDVCTRPNVIYVCDP